MQRLLTDYGMMLVLLALCLLFSVLTLKQQVPEGKAAVAELAREVQSRVAQDRRRPRGRRCATGHGQTGRGTSGRRCRTAVTPTPGSWSERRAICGWHWTRSRDRDKSCAAIVTGGNVASWRVIEQIPAKYPASADFQLLTPTARLWPDFLKRTNLLAIVDRIVVIAVIAIGMTMVIITGGIDLSVGSLIALSAVIATLVMKQLGGPTAPAWAVCGWDSWPARWPAAWWADSAA